MDVVISTITGGRRDDKDYCQNILLVNRPGMTPPNQLVIGDAA
jgi:hypothetical protein